MRIRGRHYRTIWMEEDPGFDVTPARLVTGPITERGVCEASETGIESLFQK
jgi:methylthioribose-1-phosphate isomerase